jgi:hypothetical protein
VGDFLQEAPKQKLCPKVDLDFHKGTFEVQIAMVGFLFQKRFLKIWPSCQPNTPWMDVETTKQVLML